MLCPHCGSDQPIAEICAQCGGNLLQAAPTKITIIEEIATNRWIKLFFAFSLLVALFGAYFLVRGYRQQTEVVQEAPVTESLATPAGENAAAEGAPSNMASAAGSVLFIEKLGEYDPQMVRSFEEQFQGKVDEIVIDQPHALDFLRTAKAHFWITLGPQSEAFLEKHQAGISGLSPPAWRLSLTDRLTEETIKQPHFLALSKRPSASKVMSFCKQMMQLRHGKIVVFSDPTYDQEYTDALYAAALENGITLEIMEARNTQSVKKNFDLLAGDYSFLLILESPAFMTPEAQASTDRYIRASRKPVIAVGATLGKSGAVAELQADLSAYVSDLPQIFEQLQSGSLPSAKARWLTSRKVIARFYRTNAQELGLLQMEQLGRLLESRNELAFESIQ